MLIMRNGKEYLRLSAKWIFPVSREPRDNYIYVPELNVYRSQISVA